MDKRLCIATATPSRTKYILKSSYLNWCGLFLWVTIMTIQSVDLKVPGGDTPRSAFTKINANFASTENAASRVIGSDATGKIANVGLLQEALNSPFANGAVKVGDAYDANNFSFGKHYTSPSTVNGIDWGMITTAFTSGNGGFQLYNGVLKLDLRARIKPNNGVWGPWHQIYTSANTTKEAGTGYLVASSPVLKVQHNSFEKVHEAEQLDIDVQHLATGVYAITGTTGLRSEGWDLKPPKDINGNVLCICEATQDGDVITLKTYKKKFDFETVSIVADYEQPTDIPDGAEVMLRFNDLPTDNLPAQ